MCTELVLFLSFIPLTTDLSHAAVSYPSPMTVTHQVTHAMLSFLNTRPNSRVFLVVVILQVTVDQVRRVLPLRLPCRVVFSASM